MESIKIKTDSQVTLCINGDESRYITFDTEDMNLYVRLKALYRSLCEKEKELTAKGKEIEMIEGEDEYGVPLAGWAIVDLQDEFAKSVTEGLDSVFGEGTCYRLFGNTFNPEAYGELLKGIMTRIAREREKKMNAALKNPSGKRVMK